jgi:predicted RNase H-like nuclease (RuvC/YqgF family)
MRGVRFDMIGDSESDHTTGKYIGFIAQELEKVIPEVVVTGPDGYKSVAYDKLTAVLTEAIKEQQKLIESVKQENKDLKSELEELKTLVNNLLAKQNVQNDN